ncbi:DUF2088 domain-containing protein [Desulfobulbus rhabdoformis]|uniref:lactate racemase domain-containing protein n=1 Tax=Desulfobulbus rhabdoformis TaxID=34032 RepID=UPI001962F68E|nr:lactate racemase domain-containing protein [Desulfobulbus rhabdoformis]MBM9613908.1 DUF2088 domain-containing protein [Desulfobulbus rhabdoformis]
MNNKVNLCFGEGTVPFDVSLQTRFLDPHEPENKVDLGRLSLELRALLPSSLPPGPVAIVVADKTRLCGYPRILPWLIDLLLSCGISGKQICFYISYGTHIRQSEEESLACYGETYRQFHFVHHESEDRGQFVTLGTTKRKTPIRIRRDLLQAGFIITVGAISHHYFAGFGGGRKLLFPGLAEREAIWANHRLFLDSSIQGLAPGCTSGQLLGNPLAEDLKEIDEALPHYISIHGLLGSDGQVVDYRCGRSYTDFLDVCKIHDHHFRLPNDKKYSLVLASAGGFPKDINFIQSHKAINNAAGFVEDGGHLIVLAQCRDGIGSTTFLPYFALGGAKRAFAELEKCYSGNGGTALSMMAKTRRIRISLLSDLSSELCRQIGVSSISTDQAQAALLHDNNAAIIKNSSMLIC